MKQRKQIALVLSLLLFVACLFAACGKESQETAPQLLLQGKSVEAFEEYVKSYGLGNADAEMEAAVLLRLREIKSAFDNKTMSEAAAKEELELLKSMRIASLQTDIDEALAYIDASGQEQNTSLVPAETTSQAPVTTTHAAAQPDTTPLQSEPLPVVPASPRIVSASTIVGEVLASSNVNEARSFGANKAIDGYYDSCWCVNTANSGGAGAKIRFELAQTSVVSGVMLVNGNLYLPYDGLYRSNGQVKNFTLTFSDGSTKNFTASYNGTASSGYQYFDFGTPVTTSSVTLTVNSGYVGEKYTENVCIGEFDVY